MHAQNNPSEEWRPAMGWPGYLVSSHGRVMSLKYTPMRRKRSYLNSKGYPTVKLTDGRSRQSSMPVHRLVMITFVGPRPDGMEVRHLDGDKTNNHLANLRYGTPSENMLDQVRHGQHYCATRTHCRAGHPYSDENTYVSPDGRRRCVICRRASVNRSRSRRRSNGSVVGEVAS